MCVLFRGRFEMHMNRTLLTLVNVRTRYKFEPCSDMYFILGGVSSHVIKSFFVYCPRSFLSHVYILSRVILPFKLPCTTVLLIPPSVTHTTLPSLTFTVYPSHPAPSHFLPSPLASGISSLRQQQYRESVCNTRESL